MAFKTVLLLLGCAVIAQSNEQCDENDPPKGYIEASLVQLIATCKETIRDFNFYVPKATKSTIEIISTGNEDLAKSEENPWLSAFTLMENCPVTRKQIEACQQSRPQVRASLQRALDETKACNKDAADDLLWTINNLCYNESEINAIMIEAQRVADECVCQNDCLSRLLPLASEAVTLVLKVPEQLIRVANATGDYVLVSKHCGRRKVTTEQLNVVTIFGDRAECIQSAFLGTG